MGKVNVMVYVVVVGFLGLVATALAFAAEATKIKASDINLTKFGNCEYPRTPANILGYAAALLTLIVQITICGIARCPCYQRNDSNAQSFQLGAINCYILSCVGSIIGISLLLSAANLSTRQEFLPSTGLCYTVRPGIFAAGGVMALLACILGLCSSYYFSVIRHSATRTVPYQDDIAMANSQFDAASTYSKPKQQQYV
ncbi:hypothetical protein SOVF_124560 [Spinacia oleracea]|uniref:Uncharacterized protein n=1 Tax=Spinacia oleracea TaxID=3562 RepID=A0A9R0JTE1_SPIOL|nr:uncharacterized protein LOC110786199 [Spinacia oleracea]KNA12551.1 hypothetical protein SOVF_124560 [Spinacia oleracea]